MRLLLFVFVCLSSFFISCSSSDSNSNNNGNPNNNGNSFTNSMDYEFTLTINGEVHKVKGNTTNGIPYGSSSSSINWINNCCYADNGQLRLDINDVTASNYIFGQNLQCIVSFPNLLTGINQASVSFFGGYFQTLSTNLGSSYTGLFYFQTASGASNSTLFNKLPITITDLGTSSSNAISGNIYTPYNFGQTLKGNYSGTIYLPSNNGQFTIPVQLTIDFKALRRY